VPGLAVGSVLTVFAGRNCLTETGWIGRDCCRAFVFPLQVHCVGSSGPSSSQILGEVGHWHYLWHLLLSLKNSVFLKAFGLSYRCFKVLLERHGIFWWECAGGFVDVSVALAVSVFLRCVCWTRQQFLEIVTYVCQLCKFSCVVFLACALWLNTKVPPVL